MINRYREATAALGYEGDSVLNSMGDMLACWLGWQVARKIGWRGTWMLFVAAEAALLMTIRDSLLLSVLMLAMPLDFVKQWQLN